MKYWINAKKPTYRSATSTPTAFVTFTKVSSVDGSRFVVGASIVVMTGHLGRSMRQASSSSGSVAQDSLRE
jgi:energy-converting hydrogenase Eha subunit B